VNLSNSNLVIQILVGLIALGGGLALVKSKALLLKLLGLLFAVGGAAVLLEPVPMPVSTAASANLKFFLVTIVFVASAILMVRTGPGTAAKATGVVLAFLGVLALFVQFGSLVSVPGGLFGDIIQAAFDSISRIFAQANTQLK
jgi:hypothetical protein